MSTLYKDRLVEVTDEEMVFHRYYFPFGGDKHVPLSLVESVRVSPRSIWSGSWRIWGSGDLRTWFPFDGARPSRDRVFITFLRGHWRRIGFTVEHSQPVIEILKRRGLLQATTSS